MIWATVSSWSCFCWLYRASLSSAAKNTINLTLGLTICWCPCVELSIVLLEKDVCYVCFLDKTLLAFALLHFVLQGQTCLLFQVSLDFLLLHSNPLWWTGHLFLVLFLEGLVDIHRISKLQLLQHQWLGHRLELLWSTTPWIWFTIAFWILVKPLHLGTMLSKWMRCTKNCNACSQHWSTERALLYNQAQQHIAQPMLKKLNKLSYEVLLHSPYSSDLLPTEYHFFKHLNNFLQRKYFHNKKDAENVFQ